MNHEDKEENWGVTYEDARRDGGARDFLWKGNVRELASQTRASIETQQKLIRLGGKRTTFHLIRMLNPRRSEVEFDFATDFTDFLSALNYWDLDYDIRVVIGEEGPDTTMWWTFAPYLYKHLRVKGIEKNEALTKILDWAKIEESVSSQGNYSNIHLSGLEEINRHGHATKTYILGKNLNGASHIYTDLKAAEIVRDVFKV